MHMKRAGLIARALVENEKDSRTRETVEALIVLCDALAERIASGELTATEDPAEEKVVDVLEAGRPADNTRTRLPPLAHTISGLERSPPACRCW